MVNKAKKIKYLIITSIVLLISLLCLYFAYNAFKEKAKQDAILKEQEELLRQEKEKEEMIESLIDNGVLYLTLNEELNVGNYISEDESIVKIENGVLKSLKLGSTLIYSNKDKYLIEVTDIFEKARIDNNKESLPCGRYSDEEAILLDNILQSRIEYAGYKTRAGVLAAARFLALEFEYRLPYFYENGRLDGSTGHPYADGEGRFYHKGLYLSKDKYSLLDPNGYVSGPQTWGCVMFSGAGGNIPNGLDCSGYVSWCLYQAGFDPGDVGGGAGIYDGAYNLPDLGVGDGGATSTKVVDPDAIQAGDIIAWEGTIAIVVGVDENNIYVAHEYWDNDLEVVTTPKDNLANSEWQYVTLMDNYYNQEGFGQGKYSPMW